MGLQAIRKKLKTVPHLQKYTTVLIYHGLTGTFDEFFELFLRGDVAYGDYMYNVLSWWALRARPNVLVLTYEDMHRDLSAVVAKVAVFLGKTLCGNQVAAICDHCRFEQMRANPMTSAASMPKVVGEGEFMRRGQVGDWRNYFSEDQSRRMDEWVGKHAGSQALPFDFGMQPLEK